MSEHAKPSRACLEHLDRLVDLSDGELPADEREDIVSHVAACDGCREELHRLNASLAALRNGIVAGPTVRLPQSRSRTRTAIVGIGALAAALLLAIGIASLLKAPVGGDGNNLDGNSVAGNRPTRTPSPNDVPLPDNQTNDPGLRPAHSLTADDAFRRIAILEQQARLETSLALTPDDPWFADQRAANEQLLSTFRQAAAALGTADHSSNETPDTKGTL